MTASFGGPVIPFAGIAIPVPYLNVGAMHGYSSNLSLYGNAHITALLFKNVGADAGFAARLLQEKGALPEITLNGRAYFFWDAFRGNTTRLYPAAALTASYRTGERSLLYFGADHLYQFTTPTLFVTSFIGYEFPLSDSWLMQVESKWVAMNRNTEHGIFEGAAAIGGRGNIGLYAGFQWEMP